MNECKDCFHYCVCDCDVNFGLYVECPQYKSISDVIAVVKCKDCKYWKNTGVDTITELHWGVCQKPLGDYRYCETAEYDYCSYGERKEE